MEQDQIPHELTAPKTASEVRSFLGFANTCREYVPEYAVITTLRITTTKEPLSC
jgi:hypothetical protein